MTVKNLKIGPIQTNCYIAYDNNKVGFVVDPPLYGEKINDYLKENGITITHILLTHAHFDHVGGVKKLKALNPNAVVVIGQPDAEAVGYVSDSFRVAIRAYIDDYTDIPLNEFVVDGDKIISGDMEISVLSTPGHTRGGVCYLVENNIFTGDTLFKQEVGRCDLDGGDYHTILRSVKRLAALPGDYIVYPGHEDFSTMEHERVYNRYIKSNEV